MRVLEIPLDAVMLDRRNPRIAHSLEVLDAEQIDDDYIELALEKFSPSESGDGASATYASLRDSIRKSGGLIAPIIVRAEPEGKYLTIEGNTRVVIYRELRKTDPSGPWSTISAIVHEGIDENREHAIRLQAHLIGPRPWRAYAKGRYLHYLYHKCGLSLNDLLDYCGGNARKREIQEYIEAYADFEEHFSKVLESSPGGYSKFSAFIELQKPNIKSELARHGHTVSEFAQWVADGNINPLNSVRTLPRILANAAAKEAFLKHDAREAIKLLDQPSASTLLKDAPMEQLAAALANKLRTQPWDEAMRIMGDPGGARATALVDCHAELRQFVRMMDPDIDVAE